MTMATMKAYTDIEQSKKLAEILPLESADMHYWKRTQQATDYAISVGHSKEWQEGFESKCIEYIPCWSLAALLRVLPKEIVYDKHIIVFLEFHVWENSLEYVNNTDYTLCVTESYDSPIDACYEMILKLKEQNLL